MFGGRRTQESYNIHGIQRSKNPGKSQYTWHSKVEEPRKVTIYMAFKGRRTQEIYMAFKGRRTQEGYNIHGIQRSKNPGKLQYTWHSKV